jgi:hypothetical protein
MQLAVRIALARRARNGSDAVADEATTDDSKTTTAVQRDVFIRVLNPVDRGVDNLREGRWAVGVV